MDPSQHQLKFIFQKHKIEFIKKLGSGGFGSVYLGNSISQEFLPLAIKCITRKQLNKKPSLEKYLSQEINTMYSLKHTNIVKLLKTFAGKHQYTQSHNASSQLWSTANLEISILISLPSLKKYSNTQKHATSSFKYLEDSKQYIKKISYTETSNAKTFFSKKYQKQITTSAKQAILVSPKNSVKLPNPNVVLQTLWLHKFSHKNLTISALTFGRQE